MTKQRVLFVVLLGLVLCFLSITVQADTAEEINQKAFKALEALYQSSPAARELSRAAKGILVFPRVIKAGLVYGGLYGEGALIVNGEPAGYYKFIGGSYGLQAGLQTFGYAMFFMTDQALAYLQKSKGWEIGVGPSVVVVNKGLAKSLTTTTAKADVYAFFFNQKGLMAGLGLQGSKISKFTPGGK